MIDITGKIAQANGRLKASGIGIKVELRGDRLWLRGILPPKTASSKETPYQQRISLHHHANAQGIKLAEAEARKISALLAYKEFKWEPYLKTRIEQIERSDTVKAWVDRFETDYFSRRSRSPKTETTLMDEFNGKAVRIALSKQPIDTVNKERFPQIADAVDIEYERVKIIPIKDDSLKQYYLQYVEGIKLDAKWIRNFIINPSIEAFNSDRQDRNIKFSSLWRIQGRCQGFSNEEFDDMARQQLDQIKKQMRESR